MGSSNHLGENIFYVYIYINPRNNSPFYVGKGHKNRHKGSLSSAKNKKNTTYLANKIRKIQRETGQDPEIILFKTGLSEDEAFSLEKELIARWGRRDIKTGCLANMTSGGEGTIGMLQTEEMIRKRSEAMKGKTGWSKGLTKETDERVKKIGDSNKGKKAWNEGIELTEEQKANYKNQFEPGHIPWNKGLKGCFSDEAREKKRIARAKQVFSEESKKKQAESLRITWAIRRGLLL